MWLPRYAQIWPIILGRSSRILVGSPMVDWVYEVPCMQFCARSRGLTMASENDLRSFDP